MADQILQARDGATTADLGVTNSQGNVNLAVHDEDTNITLDGVLAVLNSIQFELQSKIESGGTVALDTATLNALESVTASVSNFPTDYPDSAALAQLQATVSALSGTLDVAVQSPVALDAATLSALESITAVVSNWPTTFPDQHDQPLTDTQLRSAPVEITGTVNVSGGSSTGLTDAELRASPVETYEGPLIVSDENSSLDQTLAAGETFLGPWVDALDAVDIRANIISYQQPLETELQWGSVVDGIVRSTSSEIPAGVGTAFSFPVTARFYRVRVTNVGNGPTDVLSRVGLSRRASSLAQMAIATPIKDSSLAGLTRSVLTGKDNQGNYQNVRVNPQGRLAAEVSAHDIDSSTSTAFTSGHVENGEVKATEGSGGRIYVVDQHSQSLTDAELRAAPVVVDTGLSQPLQDGGQVSVSNHPTEYPDTVQQSHLENRYGGGKQAYAEVLTTAGDNIAITPVTGNAIRVYWVSFVPDQDNTSSTVVTVKIGSRSIYVGYAMAHWEIFEGEIGEQVIVNLSSSNKVAVTIHYKEV